MYIYFDFGSTMINSLHFRFDKNNEKFIFISFKTKSYTEKVCNISKSPIETYRKYTFCVHMHNLHPVQINLLYLESRSKFAPGKFASECKFFKHHSHGKAKNTPGVQIVHMNPA